MLPSSGSTLSIGMINVEKGVSSGTTNSSLQQLTFDFSGSSVDQNQPYAISEFYGKTYNGSGYPFYFSTGYTTYIDVCLENIVFTLYTNVTSIDDIDVGNTIFYENSFLSNRYNGNNKWYKITPNYSNYGSILIDSNGVCIGIYRYCVYSFLLTEGAVCPINCNVLNSGTTVYGNSNTIQSCLKLYTDSELLNAFNGEGKCYYDYNLGQYSEQISVDGYGNVTDVGICSP
jgi:hypothetical protein